MLSRNFDVYETECRRTLEAGLVLPAYDYVLKCSHAFNLLDARGAIAVTERTGFILRVRALAKACCAAYIETVRGGAVRADAGDGSVSCVMARDLVFEIGVEEMPSTPLYAATSQLQRGSPKPPEGRAAGVRGDPRLRCSAAARGARGRPSRAAGAT